jgi:hypothetical protein
MRAGKELSGITRSGAISAPLIATGTASGIRLKGELGVFFVGTLQAQLFDRRKRLLCTAEVAQVDPRESVVLEKEIAAPASADRVTLHLLDSHGVDRGAVATARVMPP